MATGTQTAVVERPPRPVSVSPGLVDADGRVLDRPAGPWAMAQGWQHLLFAHWPLAPAVLAPHVPAGLALDTYDGQAWLGITPFLLRPFRLHGLPPVPGLAAFHEINVRTYVVGARRPGVLFLSLDADNLLGVLGARLAYHLPYFHAQMAQRIHGEAVRFSSRRVPSGPFAAFRAAYRPVGTLFPAAPGSLTHWLTARFRLFTADRHGRLYRSEIRHRPWVLQAARATISGNTMAWAHDIRLQPCAPLLYYSRGVLAHIWPPEPLD